MKVTCAMKIPDVLSSYSEREFAVLARALFPEPSHFMGEFLDRFERLADFEEELERHNAKKVEKNEFDCPACGASLVASDQ